jgi:hypothetical protein
MAIALKVSPFVPDGVFQLLDQYQNRTFELNSLPSKRAAQMRAASDLPPETDILRPGQHSNVPQAGIPQLEKRPNPYPCSAPWFSAFVRLITRAFCGASLST